MTRFRHPAALAVTAVLVLLGSIPLASQGGVLAFLPLIPLVFAVWAWRVGTDVNTYGLRVKSLLSNRVVAWEEVTAIAPDQRGGVIAALASGQPMRLTAVKTADIPRIMTASGKQPAEAPAA